MSATEFVDWFESNGGSFDVNTLGFATFPALEGGRGVIARKDIPEGRTLFTIPRSLTLSTRTSSLPVLFGTEHWKSMGVDQDWSGLILCMMWESANPASKWSPYFDILPTQFDTPMFWNEEELAELQGTSVVDKLGREQAEMSYSSKVLPAINSRPDIFLPEKIPLHYSLEVYHLMGSRILSRSFSIERWDSGEDEERNITVPTDSREDAMDTDTSNLPEGLEENHSDGLHHEEIEDDDADDSSDTAMVPMADMLNARYGSENAKLFYEDQQLRMVATKPIKAGEQIWNTYGDLPNAELLRRYGHVDLLPLPQGSEGNPGDVVEVRADIIVSVIAQCYPSLTSESSQKRVDWWLEEGGDDVFVLESDLELPLLLLSFIHLLVLSAEEWDRVRGKGKPPKPKVDERALSIFQRILEERLKIYPTDLKVDEGLLSDQNSPHKRNAIIVRIGEKRVLNGMMDKVYNLRQKEYGNNKRKGRGEEPIPSKKVRK